MTGPAKRRIEFSHLFFISLLVNAALLGLVVGLLILPGPLSRQGGPLPPPGNFKGMPEFGFKGKMTIIQLFEENREDVKDRVRRAEAARRAFANALEQEDVDPSEIAKRGEALKKEMNAVGDAFLDLMIATAPKLPLDERKELASFLTSLPSPMQGMFPPGKPDGPMGHEDHGGPMPPPQ